MIAASVTSPCDLRSLSSYNSLRERRINRSLTVWRGCMRRRRRPMMLPPWYSTGTRFWVNCELLVLGLRLTSTTTDTQPCTSVADRCSIFSFALVLRKHKNCFVLSVTQNKNQSTLSHGLVLFRKVSHFLATPCYPLVGS